jgi:hypothetical protein
MDAPIATEGIPAGTPFVYEAVQQAIRDDLQVADHIDNKAAVLFGFTTTYLGILASSALADPNPIPKLPDWLRAWLFLTTAATVWGVVCTVRAFIVRSYRKAVPVDEMLDERAGSAAYLQEEFLGDLKAAYHENRDFVATKGRNLKYGIVLTAIGLAGPMLIILFAITKGGICP